MDGQRLTNWTRTDGQGRFEYGSLIARRYTLEAHADRYVTLEYGQKRYSGRRRTATIRDFSFEVTHLSGPVADYALVIFSSDPTKWTTRSRFVLMARPTQQGRFDVHGLPPEQYLAIALPSVSSSEWQDPDFLQQLRARATPLTLNEGESRAFCLLPSSFCLTWAHPPTTRTSAAASAPARSG